MSEKISFVSESVIEEQRKQRQEEWSKNRKESDPIGKLVANFYIFFFGFVILYIFKKNR